MQETDFVELSPEEIASIPNEGEDGGHEQEYDFVDLSPDEISSIETGEVSEKKSIKGTGPALGLGGRVSASITAETGLDTADMYGEYAGEVVDTLTSIAPFAKGFLARGANNMKQGLVDAAETGNVDDATWEDSRAMKVQLAEWDKTEGMKYDIENAMREERLPTKTSRTKSRSASSTKRPVVTA